MGVALLDGLLDAALPRGGEPAWLADMRRGAAADLVRDGLHAQRSEAWKYTPLRALGQRAYVRGDDNAALHAIDPASFALPACDGPRLVFVNGVFRADLSQRTLVAGLDLRPLSAVLREDPELVRAFLERRFEDPAHAFARLNGALASEGPVIRVADGACIDAPVHVVFAGAAADAAIAWQARAILEVGAGARLRVIEHHVGAQGVAHLGNLVTQVAVDSGAQLDLVQVQDAPQTASLIRRSDLVIGTDASATLHSIEIGASLVRHDLSVALAGDRARFASRGVFALRGRQHADTRMDVRHVARDTASDVVWRGVADQRARGVFHGGITILAGADGSDAQLSNKNLLLSAQAEIDTQPVLEIHADEVKASHGATVGQLDERALFYLRTRGIGAAEARSLLTLAFCRVALDSLDDDTLREHLDRLLLDHLPAVES
jgi:Fe-S cluster assembly protein SufD